MDKFELHIHSTFSDGELSPREIVDLAYQANIKILSFTDHDEIGAYWDAFKYAKTKGITVIPGIELNTDGVEGELHILGYFFDPNHPDMLDHITWRKKERKQWAQSIIALLGELGYPISFEEVEKEATGDIIVRTHIAKVLENHHYFATAQDAYESLLIKGKPAFVRRSPFTARDAIELIHTCDGEAYLAHPGAYTFTVNERDLLNNEIDGIEVFHSKHSEEDQAYWQRFAVQNGLKISGGSDHHGPDSRNPYPVGSIQMDDSSKEYWMKRVDLLL